jgi:ABC-2 type transport system permease protein
MPLSVYVGFSRLSMIHTGQLQSFFSMIPLIFSIVMLMRPFGVPLWQIAISVTLLFGSFFVSFGLLQNIPNRIMEECTAG